LDALLKAAGEDIARRNKIQAELKQSLDSILARAGGEGWSTRQLAEKIGISRRTLSRILSGQVDLAVWLPKLRSAIQRLADR
jgi:transcriptional regulator with XRE-family HTH domain